MRKTLTGRRSVYAYQRPNLDLVKAIVVRRLGDVEAFGRVALELTRRKG